jgi:hypothetical protein
MIIRSAPVAVGLIPRLVVTGGVKPVRPGPIRNCQVKDAVSLAVSNLAIH